MKKNLAFSMVEVMITLVILGVIAVLTVPGLVDSANKRINDAAANKADYAVSQAAMRLQAECPRLRNCNDGRGVIANLEDLLNKANANNMLTYYVSNVNNGHIYVFVTIKDDETFPILYEINNSGLGARPTSANVGQVLNRAKDANTMWAGNKSFMTIYNEITNNNGTNIRIDYNCKTTVANGTVDNESCY